MVLLLCDGFAPDITLTGNVNTNVRARTMPIFPEVCTVALTLSRPYQKQDTYLDCKSCAEKITFSCRSRKTGISSTICHRLFDHVRQLVCDMDRRPDASGWQVIVRLWSWAFSQFPYLVEPDLT